MLRRIYGTCARQFRDFQYRINNQHFQSASAGYSCSISTTNSEHQELRSIANALKTFHEKYNHFIVPQDFMIETHISAITSNRGEKRSLGKIVVAIRSAVTQGNANSKYLKPFFVKELNKIGFPLHTWTQYEFENITLPGVKTFHALHGHLLIPQQFKVPSNDQNWAKQLWNFRLGYLINRLRKGLIPLTDEQIGQLDAIGFIWKVTDAIWERDILPALRIYKNIHGHLMVPTEFCVPSNCEIWPKRLWGFTLGSRVRALRKGLYSAQLEQDHDKLIEMGFIFDVYKTQWETKILPSLQVFAKVYRHGDVPYKFVVPSQAPWPKEAWGMNLGTLVAHIRSKALYRKWAQLHAEDLAEFHFVWNREQRLEHTVRKIIVPCLRVFWERFPHQVSIPIRFCVPDENDSDNASPWPDAARGFKLGHWISRCRSGRIALPEDLTEELENAGFTWTYTEARWQRYILPALEAFAATHAGSCQDMGTRFNVPHSEPYPRQTWGLNLGGIVWHIRNGDTYADPDKVAQLKRLKVVS